MSKDKVVESDNNNSSATIRSKVINKNIKFIFVTGGVMSGLGKGVTAASLAKLLQSAGFKTGIMKCDPYLNSDSGTLNPAEHGEVFVTNDGAETDLDLGHYERFLNIELDKSSSLMSGKVLSRVIQKERNGDYLGKTVQVVPHVTDMIIDSICESALNCNSEVHFVEIGGTIGDYESLSFYEAIRQMKNIFGKDNCLYLHLVYVPYLTTSMELKTKPAQSSVRELRQLGITLDILAVRSEFEIGSSIKHKLSLTCDIDSSAVFSLPTMDSIYQVPIILESQKATSVVLSKLKLKNKRSNLKKWKELVDNILKTKKVVRIGLVAKYLGNSDTYASLTEAIMHAAWSCNAEADIVWIDAENTDNIVNELENVDGVVIPGGFGNRGIEGKIIAINYSRLNNLPILGICLGFQMMVVEFSRNILGLREATSMEFDPEGKDLVISLLAEKDQFSNLGGTMRLGNYQNKLIKDSKLSSLYKSKLIIERHRHRFEFNNKYREALEKAGLIVSATTLDDKLVEAIEIKDNNFFIGVQFHPEFKSRPEKPHPLFVGLIKASTKDDKSISK